MDKAIKLLVTGGTVVTGTLALLVATPADAATITQGFTFSSATDEGGLLGNHFHSSTGGDFGNPAGKAEVGAFFGEEVRGLSEYDLSGLDAADSAFVTFDVFLRSGLFPGENDFPFDGNINVVAYLGNNTEDVSDFQAPTVASVGTFSTTGLSVGDILSFDITSVFNGALASDVSSLGIRLQVAEDTNPDGGALVFDSFRLTTDNQSTQQSVPEASTVLGLLAVLGLAKTTRKRQFPG